MTLFSLFWWFFFVDHSQFGNIHFDFLFTFRTSLFIITSLVYAMLLIVVCIAYVISDVSTHRLPVVYYEGYFTYLYGASILFLLYVFCFLLQGKFYFKTIDNHFIYTLTLPNKNQNYCQLYSVRWVLHSIIQCLSMNEVSNYSIKHNQIAS